MEHSTGVMLSTGDEIVIEFTTDANTNGQHGYAGFKLEYATALLFLTTLETQTKSIFHTLQ
jgi:hypothetical protein